MNKLNKNINIESDYIALIDLGSSYLRCAIISANDDITSDKVKILSVSSIPAKGFLRGYVVNWEDSESSIRTLVEKCEKYANVKVSDVVVCASSSIMSSEHLQYSVELGGHTITQTDIKNITEMSWQEVQKDTDKEYLHCIPIQYSVDGNKYIETPVGMHGLTLSATMNMLAVKPGTLKNIKKVFESSNLNVCGVIASSLAVCYGIANNEDKVNYAVIDFGHSSTSLSIYNYDHLELTVYCPIGGDHITKDIAQGLDISYKDAEQIKMKYGKAITEVSDDLTHIYYENIKTGEKREIQQSILTGIIKPRLEEIFVILRDKLKQFNISDKHINSAYFLGNGHKIKYLDVLVKNILDIKYIHEKPNDLSSNISFLVNHECLEHLGDNQFSSLNGLIKLIGSENQDLWLNNSSKKITNWFAKTWLWIKENI